MMPTTMQQEVGISFNTLQTLGPVISAHTQVCITYRSAPMPRSIKYSRILRLQAQFLQPGILRVVDEQIGGGVGLCSAHDSQESEGELSCKQSTNAN